MEMGIFLQINRIGVALNVWMWNINYKELERNMWVNVIKKGLVSVKQRRKITVNSTLNNSCHSTCSF